ncbi:MAG: hypothetical protein WC423_24865 [Vulcanimicrobiota bacterium]
MQIHNEFDLYRVVLDNGKSGDNREYAMAMVSKTIYKETSCGAWVSCSAKGIHLGSIVEGSDAEVTASVLPWGCEAKEFWDTLQWVEDEVDRIWKEEGLDSE